MTSGGLRVPVRRIAQLSEAFAAPTFPPPKISGFEAYRHPQVMNAAAVSMQHVD